MTKTFINPAPDFSKYRPSGGCIVVNNDGRILYCARADIPDAWQMPQGGIDPGEDPEEGALRELYEETAIKNVEVLEAYPDWLTYPFRDINKDRGAPQQDGYIGQAQKWFLLKYNGDPDAINLDAAQDKEFSAYLWATPEYILDTVAEFRKPLYEECFKHFGFLKK